MEELRRPCYIQKLPCSTAAVSWTFACRNTILVFVFFGVHEKLLTAKFSRFAVVDVEVLLSGNKMLCCLEHGFGHLCFVCDCVFATNSAVHLVQIRYNRWQLACPGGCALALFLTSCCIPCSCCYVVLCWVSFLSFLCFSLFSRPKQLWTRRNPPSSMSRRG